MIPIGFIFIYDLFNLVVNIDFIISELIFYSSQEGFNLFLFILNYLDITVVINLIFLYWSFSSLSIADGTKKNDSFEDNFYDDITNRKALISKAFRLFFLFIVYIFIKYNIIILC